MIGTAAARSRSPSSFRRSFLPGTITVDWAGAATAEGKSYEGLKVTTNDLEVILYLDPNHRLQRIEVPSSKAAIIRE